MRRRGGVSPGVGSFVGLDESCPRVSCPQLVPCSVGGQS